VGDGHAVQGDGEVCVTALECSLEGVFRLTVRKDLGVAGAANGTSWVPIGASRPNQVRAAALSRSACSARACFSLPLPSAISASQRDA